MVLNSGNKICYYFVTFIHLRPKPTIMAKRVKTPVRIRTKELSNGTKSIYLDIYHNGERRYEFLKLYLNPGRDPLTKIANENAMTAAIAIQAERIKQLTNEAAGIKINKDNTTLQQYVLDRIATKDKQSKTHTHLEALIYHLNNFTRKPIRIADIDKKFIEDFLSHIATFVLPGKDRPMKETTQSHQVRALRTMLNSALQDGIISANPFDRIPTEDLPKIRTEDRCYLTAEEVKLLEDNISEPTHHAFLFSCYTGLRISDICHMRWENIATNDSRLVIRKIIIKNKKFIDLPLNAKATAHLPERKEDNAAVFDLPSLKTINSHIKKLCAEVGIKKKVSFHTARHTFATMALTLGADIYTVSELLGHADISTTQIYAKIVDAKKEKAVDLFDKL